MGRLILPVLDLFLDLPDDVPSEDNLVRRARFL